MSDGRLSIAVNSDLGSARRVMILEDADGNARVAMTPAVAERLGVERAEGVSLDVLRRSLSEAGVPLHDPDFVFYLPDAPPPVRPIDPRSAPRRLAESDRGAFDAFQTEASEQDLEDSYVELDHWAVFGCFEGDRLVSAASAYPWGEAALADLGVLTLPDARGRGHARALVQSIGQFAREQGYELQYRCQVDNAASVALAKASGLVLLGRWEVISPDAPDDAGAS
ncbi:GNAT family N-acetyltransferase [Caulobacter mirabilis]|uniref:GNAT family N-acetyltransferase n=1 Tax=Caulobacter mirabilis TaxID=69666 RepID=UPI001C0EE900|nr:GNAT family N-acetyltransferase [Caulobacter mirabilis]